MRYSVAFTAIIGATSVTAFPVAGPITALRERGFFDSVGNYFGGSGTSTSTSLPAPTKPAEGGATTGRNPVQDALNNVVGGGALSPQIIKLLQDGGLAQHTLKTVASGSSVAQIKTLLKDQTFLSRAGALATDDKFLGELAVATTSTHAASQALTLAQSTDYLGFLSGIVGDKDIFQAITGALTSGGFDLGGFLSGRAQSQSVWDLVGSVSGSASLVNRLEALFKDKVVAARFEALVKSDGNFADELTAIVEDKDFVTHVSTILGVSPELTAKITALLSADANFGASLEALLGANFAGQITGLIGTGSIGSLIKGAFGGLGSLQAILSGYLSGGAVVSAIGNLLGSTAVTAKFTALLKGFVAGNIDLSAVVKDVIGDLGFLTKITGALGIPFQLVQKVVATITASGFFNLFFGLFNKIY
ncbi:hypothetical protein Micbo1qcDRAFT_168715 [Microdochium bolleyi]|uniref:Uncharacterized protein n=1 Tax=Microdochium bolleyi TaxID=196109 RepID=A0A136IMD6_9PEZI|nr:hypothetical protein Micbo1qcDRAFT_168715 [Microdochium bolleyi]